MLPLWLLPLLHNADFMLRFMLHFMLQQRCSMKCSIGAVDLR
jgi:hypothetical protein